MIKNLQVNSTYLFKKEGPLIKITFDYEGEDTIKEIKVKTTKGEKSFNIELKKGKNAYYLPIPDYEGIITLDDKNHSFNLKAKRKWIIFAAPSVHTDIGYTTTQDLIYKRFYEAVDKMIKDCKKLDDLRWNLEVAWQAKNFLEKADFEKRKELIELLKKKKIDLGAFYLNMLTGLCGHEELNRLCYYAFSLKRKFNIPISSASINDIPSYVWSIPTVLSLSGIKYFIGAIDQIRGPFFYNNRDNHNPFYWIGPDGNKVLTWLSHHYHHFEVIGLNDNIDKLRDELEIFLEHYDKEDYPYNVLLLYGAFGDSEDINSNFYYIVKKWNEMYDYPKIIISTISEFFEYLEGNFKDKIPELVGDGGSYWEDGAASTSKETAINRITHDRLIQAEKLSTFLDMIDSQRWIYPKEELNKAWENVIFFDEHTWGAYNSVSNPEDPLVKKQWKIKRNFAYKAAKITKELLNLSLQTLSSYIPIDKPSIIVFNTNSWEITDITKVDLESILKLGYSLNNLSLVDISEDKEVPYQILGKNLYFLAEKVPSHGYKVYEIREKIPSEFPLTAKVTEDALENEYYRIEMRDGRINSIHDKELNRELVNKENPYNFNEYIYVEGGKGSRIEFGPIAIQIMRRFVKEEPPYPNLKIYKSKTKVVKIENGPLFSSFTLEGFCKNTPLIRSKIRIFKNIKRIDIINILQKEETYEKEAAYFVFPFSFKNPEIKLEIPNGIVRPELDQMEGACKEWYAVQHWLSLSDNSLTVTLSPIHSPLVCLKDINRGKWPKKLEGLDGTIFAYILNNYWWTNYKASQGGKLRFDFKVTSYKGSIDNVSSTKFGWSSFNPPLAYISKSSMNFLNILNARVNPKKGQLLEIDKDNINILAVKKAEDGEGWIIRLQEIKGEETKVKINIPFLKIENIFECNLVEEEKEPLSPIFTLKPFSIKTIKILSYQSITNFSIRDFL